MTKKTENQPDIVLTLNYLRPGEEWAIDGNDYKTLQWFSDTKKPSYKEIEEAYPEALKAEAVKHAETAAAKHSGISKLEALGLTAEEIAALGVS